jgi:hypothetical protein
VWLKAQGPSTYIYINIYLTAVQVLPAQHTAQAQHFNTGTCTVLCIVERFIELYDIIYESSYRIMGDNLGGGEQRATD